MGDESRSAVPAKALEQADLIQTPRFSDACLSKRSTAQATRITPHDHAHGPPFSPSQGRSTASRIAVARLALIPRPNGRRPKPIEPKLIRDLADGAPPRVER